VSVDRRSIPLFGCRIACILICEGRLRLGRHSSSLSARRNVQVVGFLMLVTGGIELMPFFLSFPIPSSRSEFPILTMLLIREDLVGWVYMDFGSCEALACFA